MLLRKQGSTEWTDSFEYNWENWLGGPFWAGYIPPGYLLVRLRFWGKETKS